MTEPNYMLAEECWVWRGAINNKGYGIFRQRLTHRVTYEWANGSIPNGLNVLHRCDNPPCCNPAHLFLGTQKDNMQDMARKGRALRDRCKRGHLKSEHSRVTYDRGGRIKRECRECDRLRAKHKTPQRKAYMRNYYLTVTKQRSGHDERN